MTTALEKSDIQKIITGLKEKLSAEQTLISASIVTAGNNVGKFEYFMDGVGIILMAQDEAGIFQIEKLEGEHTDVLSITFHNLVRQFAEKEWAV